MESLVLELLMMLVKRLRQETGRKVIAELDHVKVAGRTLPIDAHLRNDRLFNDGDNVLLL